MKTFCKIIACLMVAVMMLSFVACSKTPDKTKEKPSNSNSESTPQGDADKPVINQKFNGREVKFFINGGEGSANVRSIILGEDDDQDYEVNRVISERNDKVENELGVKIVLGGTCGMQEAVSTLQPILSSKVYTYDVLGLYQYFDLGLALNDTVGSFYNYLNMPEESYLNVNAPYWNKSLFDTMTYKNTAFFITGDINLTNTGSMFVSYVNAKLWDQFKEKIKTLTNNPEGYDSIYDIVKNGYWTLDLWMELSNLVYDDTNHNDKVDMGDRVGLMTYNSQLNNIMTDMFVAGSNIHYSTFDETGTPLMSFNSKENIAFAEKLYKLLCETRTATIDWIKGEGEEDDPYIMDVFAEGNTLLNVNTLECAEKYLANMTDTYYVMPLPMFDHKQFNKNSPSLGYTTQLGDSISQYAISTTIDGEQLAATTATMELMGYYSMTMVTPAYYDKALKDRYTRNEEDKEIIDMIKEGIYTDFALVWSNQLGNTTWFFRQNYDMNGRYAKQLKTQNGLFQKRLDLLLPAIEEAFYVEN